MTDFIAHADQESDANRNMTVMVFLCATLVHVVMNVRWPHIAPISWSSMSATNQLNPTNKSVE